MSVFVQVKYYSADPWILPGIRSGHSKVDEVFESIGKRRSNRISFDGERLACEIRDKNGRLVRTLFFSAVFTEEKFQFACECVSRLEEWKNRRGL